MGPIAKCLFYISSKIIFPITNTGPRCSSLPQNASNAFSIQWARPTMTKTNRFDDQKRSSKAETCVTIKLSQDETCDPKQINTVQLFFLPYVIVPKCGIPISDLQRISRLHADVLKRFELNRTLPTLERDFLFLSLESLLGLELTARSRFPIPFPSCLMLPLLYFSGRSRSRIVVWAGPRGSQFHI